MADDLKHSFEEIDKDLSRSWIELAARVRDLSSDLKTRTVGTDLEADAGILSDEASHLCDHVERIHADVIDLLENLETRIPLAKHDGPRDGFTPDPSCNEIEKEKIQIQREQHRKSDVKEVIKALFMWVDDPKERVKDKRSD